MIHEVLHITPRPVSVDQAIQAVVRLSTELGRHLGLRNEQVVKGVVDAKGSSILLSTDHGSYRLQLGSPGYHSAEFIFKVFLSAHGVQLRALPAAPAEPGAPPAPPAVPLPQSSLFNRLTYLQHLQTPLHTLALLARPGGLAAAADQLPEQNARDALRQLLVSSSAISASTVKSALLNSGLFGIAAGQGNWSLKKLLLLLRRSSDSAGARVPLTVLNDISKVIDYIESAQVDALLHQEKQEVLYRFPLLLSDGQPLQIVMRSKPDETDETGQEPHWCLDMDMPLHNQCHLWVSAVLYAAGSLDVCVWSTDERLVSSMTASVAVLQRNLNMFDLALRGCKICLGERPSPDTAGYGRGTYPAGASMDLST
jgi:hypothetical protein